MTAVTEQSLSFITWKPEYDCIIKVINCQHKDTLTYLNTWFSDIKSMRINPKKAAPYLLGRMKYLTHFCKQHMSFEEDVLTILVTDYEFSPQEHDAHVQSHHTFAQSFLSSLSEQIGHFIKSGDTIILEGLVADSLKDVARWWFYHITNTGPPGKKGHDQIYMEYIRKLPHDRQIDLLNDIIAKAELAG
jgi:hemerythrin